MSEAAPAEATLRERITEIVALSAGLGAAFLIVNFLHFQYITVAVILYACIWDAIIASVIVLGAYIYSRRKAPVLPPTEFALTAVASNLLILLYAVMGPTVIDRSLSVYIVEKIDYRGGRVAELAMPKIISEEFMDEYRVADVRMTEQITSGTAKIVNGCIELTPRGAAVVKFTRFYRQHFLPKRRQLGSEITDELTRPYQDAPVRVAFECADKSE